MKEIGFTHFRRACGGTEECTMELPVRSALYQTVFGTEMIILLLVYRVYCFLDLIYLSYILTKWLMLDIRTSRGRKRNDNLVPSRENGWLVTFSLPSLSWTRTCVRERYRWIMKQIPMCLDDLLSGKETKNRTLINAKCGIWLRAFMCDFYLIIVFASYK